MPCVLPVLQIGFYLLHHEPIGKPHCNGLIVQPDGTHALHTSEGSREVPSTAFIETWYSAPDKKSLVAFKLLGAPVAETDPLHRLLFFGRQRAEGASPERHDTTRDMDDNVEVEEQFLDCLETEVSRADMDLEGHSRNSVTKCPVCPFRTFRDKSRVRVHLRTSQIQGWW